MAAHKRDSIDARGGLLPPFPTLHALRTLNAAGGNVPPPLQVGLRQFAETTFRPAPFTRPVPCNQDVQRASGLLLAAQMYPDSALASGWRAYARGVWSLLSDNDFDFTEDAPNYDRIDVTYVWILADLLGTEAVAEARAAAGLRDMLRRFGQQLSPAGVIPAYGDSGAANDPDPARGAAAAANASSWAWDNPWAGFVVGLERGGREFADGALRMAALRLFATGAARQPLGGAYADVADMFRLTFAMNFTDNSVAPRPALDTVGGVVLQRRVPSGSGAAAGGSAGDRGELSFAPDKLVLRGSEGGSNAPFVLSDVFGGHLPLPPHAHENQHGQINYFEVGQTPLLSSLGYDNRGPADTNSFVVRPSSETFPHAVPQSRRVDQSDASDCAHGRWLAAPQHVSPCPS